MPNLTTAEVARYAKTSTRTVHRKVKSGQLRVAQRLPGDTGAYLFRPSDVRKAFPNAEIPEPEQGGDGEGARLARSGVGAGRASPT